MISAYVVGAYAMRCHNNEAVASLLQVKTHIEWRRESYPLVAHMAFDFQTGEGPYTQFFDEARERITRNPVFFSWFNGDEEDVKNCLVQFDFVVGLHLTACPNRGLPRFPNFKRFYKYRLEPLLRDVLNEPSSFEAIIGKDPVEAVKTYLQSVQQVDDTHFHSWWGPWGAGLPELQGLE